MGTICYNLRLILSCFFGSFSPFWYKCCLEIWLCLRDAELQATLWFEASFICFSFYVYIFLFSIIFLVFKLEWPLSVFAICRVQNTQIYFYFGFRILFIVICFMYEGDLVSEIGLALCYYGRFGSGFVILHLLRDKQTFNKITNHCSDSRESKNQALP